MRLGAHIAFIDESGFLLIPPVRKTWGPRGQTPIVRHHQKRDRISAISALSISPKRLACGLYYMLYEKNIQHLEVCRFLQHLLRHLRGPVIVIWDNASIHKGAPIREICRRYPRLHLEGLPPYAPELNPDEGVWSHSKNLLANGRPDTREGLWGELILILEEIKSSPGNLRSCMHRAQLPLL
jgi:transposase